MKQELTITVSEDAVETIVPVGNYSSKVYQSPQYGRLTVTHYRSKAVRSIMGHYTVFEFDNKPDVYVIKTWYDFDDHSFVALINGERGRNHFLESLKKCNLLKH